MTEQHAGCNHHAAVIRPAMRKQIQRVTETSRILRPMLTHPSEYSAHQ